VRVIAELLGVPEADGPLLRPWSQAIVRMYEYQRSAELEDAAVAAATEFATYLGELARGRRAAPGEDLVSQLAASGELSEDELVVSSICMWVR
jgi:cytochrome P450